MKKIFIILFTLVIPAASANAQVSAGETSITTEYKQFQPAVIYMTDGDTLKANANIFLKSSTLVYKNGPFTYEVDSKRISRVDFPDKSYVDCDTSLANVVSEVKGNALLMVKTIDVPTWVARMRNAQNISNISFSDALQWTSVDTSNEEDRMYPLIKHYFYRYQGDIIPVDERAIKVKLPKDKRYIFRAVIANDEFSWASEEWLTRLLKYITP